MKIIERLQLLGKKKERIEEIDVDGYSLNISKSLSTASSLPGSCDIKSSCFKAHLLPSAVKRKRKGWGIMVLFFTPHLENMCNDEEGMLVKLLEY